MVFVYLKILSFDFFFQFKKPDFVLLVGFIRAE